MMTSRDFCYWFQGYIELTKLVPGRDKGFSASQVEEISKHLDMVFTHEIDPSHGDATVQASLNQIHGEKKPRC
jgi:hypothetical protein